MSVDTAFLEQGFRAAGDALVVAAGKAGLHLRPERLTRSARRRCAAAFRAVAVIVRRLIFLMALQVELPPPVPRAPRKAPRPQALLAGVEDVTARFGPQSGGFLLSPVKSGASPAGIPQARACSGRDGVPAGPLLARWDAITRVLKEPDLYAERLARTIRRWRKAGEPAPVCVPSASAHRLAPDLALIAQLLPQYLNRALKAWNDTG